MLTYDHLSYTLPVIGVLTFIARPFMNRSEMFKITLITAIILIYTTLLNNYIISNGDGIFKPEKINSTTGRIPNETYVFTVVQTVLTSIWALLCVRWTLPCFNFNHDRQSYQLIQWIPILSLNAATAIGYKMMIPGQESFYSGCLLCWLCPVIMLMWYGAGNFFVKKIISSFIAIMVPTFYLCWVNKKTSNIWDLKGTTNLKLIIVEEVPLEEALYFFSTNSIIVLAVLSYDKARGLMETYTFEFPERFGINWKFINQLFWTFITPEYSLPSEVTEDIKVVMRFCSKNSKMIQYTSHLYQSGIRLDLMISYAFVRVTDNVIDDESLKVKDKKPKLKVYKEFIDEVFADRTSDYDIKSKPHIVNIDWSKYQSRLSKEEISCFRAFCRTAFHQPRKPYIEVLEGYEWDIDYKLIKNDDDLIEYCNLVAGSFGPICMYIFIYRSDNDISVIDKKHEHIIERSRQIARDMQLVNIARDIVCNMLTYDHLSYTLPVIGVLTFIARPFMNRSEMFKITLITAIILIYTTLLNNYIISNGDGIFKPEKINSTTGRIPNETYVFTVVQTVLTSIWALLCVRWTLPCFNFNHDRQSYQLIQWIPILSLNAATAIGYKMMIPGQESFYSGCLLCWLCPVIMLMWYGAGNFFVKKIISSFIAIMVPTFYLCWVNKKTSNIWDLKGTTNLKLIIVEEVPLEEALYFFSTNSIIVLAVLSYDKARGLMETYTFEFPERFGINWKFINQLFWTFITPEYSLPSEVTEDIKVVMRFCSKNSKMIQYTSHLYQSGIRLDLMISYAFVRVTDNVIDDESLKVKDKKPKLKVYKEFIDEVFADRTSDYDIKSKPHIVNIDWSKYQSRLSKEEISCFRAFCRTAFHQPRKPYIEVLEGYEWDIDYKLIKNDDDLIEYCNLVAGSFGPICMYIFIYRSDNDISVIDKKHEHIIERSRQIARDMQLVNIARDIVCDSVTVGRSYLPTTLLKNPEEEMKVLCDKKDARSLGEEKIRFYFSKLIQKYYNYQSETIDAINWLPHDIKGGVLAFYYIYLYQIKVCQSSQIFPFKASVSKWNQLYISFYCIYIKVFQSIK